MLTRSLWTLTLALGLAACGTDSGTKSDTDTTGGTAGDDDDNGNDNTADTSGGGGGPEYFNPYIVSLFANFGWDGTGLVDVDSPYGTYTASILLDIGTMSWANGGFDPYATTEYCTVVLPLTSGNQAAFAQADPDLWFGIEYQGDPVSLNTCTPDNGFELDPAYFASPDDLAAYVSTYAPWGIAVGAVSADAQDFIDGYSYSGYPAGTFVGGAVEDGLLGYVIDAAIAWGFDVDQNSYTDFTTLKPNNTINIGNGISPGLYFVYPLYGVTLY